MWSNLRLAKLGKPAASPQWQTSYTTVHVPEVIKSSMEQHLTEGYEQVENEPHVDQLDVGRPRQ